MKRFTSNRSRFAHLGASSQRASSRRRNCKRASRRPLIEFLESRITPTVTIINGGGAGYVGNGGGGPPDVTGAAGPNSYLEINNTTVTLFTKPDGNIIDEHEIGDFFYNPAIGNRTLIYSQTVNIAASPGGATESGTTATITTTTPHGFVVGQSVNISGVGVAGYNGSFKITAVTATTFQYKAATSGLANSGGGTVSAQSCGVCDSTGVFDNLMGADGRFIIGEIDIDDSQNVSQYIFAVSKTNNPTKFDTANWNFYNVTTTEGSGGPSGTSWTDYPGNPGFNADAFVETFNMFGNGPTGTQVVTFTASDLAAGNPLVTSGAGQNVFRGDIPGGAHNYRPTAMQDSVAGDPMWLIHNPDTGNSIDVVKMTGVLSTSPSFPTTSLSLPAAVNFVASGGIGDPLNPNLISAIDGDDEDEEDSDPENPDGGGAFDPGTRILNAGENNNVIVAAHTVAVASGPNTLASAQPNDKNGNPLGGSGYTVGDVLTVVGGTFTTAAQLTVQTVDSNGMITAVTVSNPGSYTSLSGVNGSVTGGTGSGAKFSLFFRGELAAQWYAIDVSGVTPAFQMVGGNPNVGRVGFGNNTYSFEPAININSTGQIGFGFMESDTVGGAADSATGGFISTFVTGRNPSDPAGVMQPVVLVPAGTGTANINGRVGDFSGMSVDPVNGTFWHTNEFGGPGGPTDIANFGLFDFPPGITVVNSTMQICGDVNSVNQHDIVKLVRNTADPTMLDVFLNNPSAVPSFEFPIALLEKIALYGGGGNNALIVDSSNGLISLGGGAVPNNGVDWNAADPCPDGTSLVGVNPGEDGFNQTILQQTAGPNEPTLVTDVYTVGPTTPGNGKSVVADSGGRVQTVNFFEVSPTFDNLPAPTLTVNATNAANAINYTTGKNSFANFNAGVTDPAWGEVSIDEHEPIEFTNKANLVINAGAGSDEINLNNPNTPTGLAGITVNGQDPTASDTLIVNGTTGNDSVNFTPTAADVGTITGAGPVAIGATTIEHVHINMQGGANDLLTVTTPAGLDLVEYQAGPSEDAGTVAVRRNPGSGGSLLGMTYSHLVGFFLSSGLSFANAGGTREDSLIYHGRDLSPAGDSIDVFSNGGLDIIDTVPTLGGFFSAPKVYTPGISALSIRTYGGNDNVNFGNTLPYSTIDVDTGEGADRVTVQATPTGPITVNLPESLAPAITTISGFTVPGSSMHVLSAEVIDVNTAGNPLTVSGSFGNNVIDVTPTATGAGNLRAHTTGTTVSESPLINYSGLGAAAFNIVGAVTGFDELGIIAGPGNDVIDANQTSATSLSVSMTLAPAVAAFTQVFTLSFMEAARIDAGSGDDLVRVSVADTLEAAPAASLRFTVDGGPPNASDRLLVNDDGIGDLTLLRQAPDQRSGSVTVGVLNPVVYQNIERLDITPVNSVTGGTGTDGNGRIKVFHSDPFEYNETRLNAAQLQRVGESPTSPTIDPGALVTPFPVPGDEDWYEFRPQATGTFQVKILFDTLATLVNGRPGLPGNGDLSLDIYDANGGLIVSGVPALGGKAAIFAATNDPAFPQFNRIFVRVHGATPPSINLYDFDNIAGLITGNPGVSNVDNEGPQVTDVSINHIPTSTYNLFGLKPDNAAQGPTPPTNSLIVHFQDLPNRAPGFLYPALDYFLTPDQARGLFEVKGDATGIVAIDHVVITQTPAVLGQVPTSTIELFFNSPLLDDRYTLIVDDSLRDPANNRLDGESNADEPNGAPNFPSGDGHSGGDFVGRFTIDSRPEIGNYSAGATFIDINQNYVIDPQGNAGDVTNRDLTFQIGTISDALFAGKFEPANPALNDNDGYDKLGAYGFDNFAKKYRFLLDFNHDGVADQRIVSAFQVNAIPVAGNFVPGRNGDEIGLFDGQNWYIDNVGDNQLHLKIVSNMRGQPIVGDFNGDGKDDFATYDAKTNTFFFDLNRDGQTDDTLSFTGPLNGVTESPVAGDLNLDGIDDLGLRVSNRQGSPTPNIAEWYFIISDHTGQFLPHNTFDPYAPSPLGNDLFAQFGDYFSLPIFGNFDPPVGSGSDGMSLTNTLNDNDVNNDGVVSAMDVLMIINYVNAGSQYIDLVNDTGVGYPDVDGDHFLTASDVLKVINCINSQPAGDTGTDPGEGEAVDAALVQGSYSSGVTDDLLAMLAADSPTTKRR